MKVAILGTVGVPGNYGGFETLAENLVRYHARSGSTVELTVWCSSEGLGYLPAHFEAATLRYVKLRANGVQSIFYDMVCLWQASRGRYDRVLLLGVSGSLLLPLIRLISSLRIVTNIDGIEWRRQKWGRVARFVLRVSEMAAVLFSHDVIADNEAIAKYVRDAYGRDCSVIAYGGDHSLDHAADAASCDELPRGYALALCRVEPENNVHIILEALSGLECPFVFIGNWAHSDYGRSLKITYGQIDNITLLDPIYEPGALRAIRERALCYIHGHSAGGTNPSLVEMMHFGIPVLAYDCVFNRCTTESKALYFQTATGLAELVRGLSREDVSHIGANMLEIARRRYTWNQIGSEYFSLITRP